MEGEKKEREGGDTQAQVLGFCKFRENFMKGWEGVFQLLFHPGYYLDFRSKRFQVVDFWSNFQDCCFWCLLSKRD